MFSFFRNALFAFTLSDLFFSYWTSGEDWFEAFARFKVVTLSAGSPLLPPVLAKPEPTELK